MKIFEKIYTGEIALLDPQNPCYAFEYSTSNCCSTFSAEYFETLKI